MAAALKLYIDENLSPKIAEQLRVRGIDAICVQEAQLRGDTDENHLKRATAEGRVLVTTDSDFIDLATEGLAHGGIIFGAQQKFSLGDWVKGLEIICYVYTPNDMKNHVEYM